jgi:hypothetical protein
MTNEGRRMGPRPRFNTYTATEDPPRFRCCRFRCGATNRA